MDALYLWRKNHLKCGKRDLLYCFDGKQEYLSYKQIIQTNFSCTMISIPGFTIMEVWKASCIMVLLK